MAVIFVPVETGGIVSEGGFSRGVAWGDYDNDGDPDLVVANTINQPQFLYRNDGDGTFTGIHEGWAVRSAGWSEGVNWVDYDNDGHLDLFVANTAGEEHPLHPGRSGEPNLLFRNDGEGHLVPVSAGPLTSDSTSSSQACWADYDLDGDLDAFVVNRSDQDDMLYENLGDGKFDRHPGPWLGNGGEGRTCAWGDGDGDGDPELFVGNFLGQDDFFYRNDGAGQFTEIRDGGIVSSGGRTYGASWVDYDYDGDLDLFVTNIGVSDRNLLWRNDGTGAFRRVTVGPVVSDSGGASKGHTWGDYDNDGDLDLFISNGTEAPDMRNFFYLNRGDGTFERVLEGPIAVHADTSAGAAWADYDNDGDLDVFVANWGGGDENNVLYRNLTSEHSGAGWVILRLEALRSNRFGVGAGVRLKATVAGRSYWQTRWMLPATGYASQNAPDIHFGLGDAARIDSLEIRWPTGIVDRYSEVEAGRFWVAVEGVSLVPDELRKPTMTSERRLNREP